MENIMIHKDDMRGYCLESRKKNIRNTKSQNPPIVLEDKVDEDNEGKSS
jgi:hypothetical protein